MSVFPSPARCRGIPPDTPHTVIVSLPEWEDNVELAKNNKILIDLLEATYPRFIAHMFVKQVRSSRIPYHPFLPVVDVFCILANQHDTIGIPI
jgi:hypothetical protein